MIINAINTIKIGQRVTVKHAGQSYEAKVLRLPLLKNGKFEKGFYPTHFKVEVLGNSEYAGNRYVAYQAVNTTATVALKEQRDAAEAKAKAEKKVAQPKLEELSDIELLNALANRLGYKLLAK